MNFPGIIFTFYSEFANNSYIDKGKDVAYSNLRSNCGSPTQTGEVNMMGKTKRILAMVMAVVIFAVVLSSALFLAEEADHDCIGDGCQICLQLNLCRGVLKSLSLALLATVAALTVACILWGDFRPSQGSGGHVTLVALKVKLSN